MSLFDYNISQKVAAEDYPFHALMMAAARKADTFNFDALEKAFPGTIAELKERYNAPGGILRRDCDSDGCFTQPDGECISPYTCIHGPGRNG